MHGLRIRSSTPFARAKGGRWLAPFPRDGLVGFFVLGGSLAQSIINWAPDYGDASVIGSPVVSDNWISFDSGVSVLALPFRDFEAMTMMAVARSTDTNADGPTRPLFVGTSGASAQGASLYVSDEGQVAIQARVLSGGVTSMYEITARNGDDINDWMAISGKVDETNQTMTILTEADANTETHAASTTRIVSTTTNMHIGGSTASANGGTFDMGMCLIWRRKLSAPEEAEAYAFMQAYYAVNGGLTI